jgi:tryptophanyl-tRNA synthetase
VAQFDDEYHDYVLREFGYRRVEFEPIAFGLGGMKLDDLRHRWLCHFGGREFAKNLADGSLSQVVTGMGMSGAPHLGTLGQIYRAISLQNAGLAVEIVLGDLDAYNSRGLPLAQTTELAERYRVFIGRLGFDLSRGSARLQSGSPEVALEAARLARYAEDKQFAEAEDPIISAAYTSYGVYRQIGFPIKYAMLLMSADITYARTRGVKNILVTVGLEEHKYVRLARTLLGPIDGEVLIAGMYSRVLPGLAGFPKMSKSIPESGVHAGMGPDAIAAAIRREDAIRGQNGLSLVVQMLPITANLADFAIDDMEKVRDDCRASNDSWTRMVNHYIEHLNSVFSSW